MPQILNDKTLVYLLRYQGMKPFLLFVLSCMAVSAAHAQFDRKPPVVKKHEVGINPMDVAGVLFGAMPDRQPMSLHYKYNLGASWLRTGIYFDNFWATSTFTQRLEDTMLVQRFDRSDAWALSGSLGIEKRRPLPNNFVFTYGADFVFRYYRRTGSVRELLYDNFRIDSASSGSPQYFRNGAAIDSRDLREDLTQSRQYGLRLTAGLQHYLHPNWIVHLQGSLAYFYGRELQTSYFPATGMTVGSTFNNFEWQRWPLVNELAVYYRF